MAATRLDPHDHAIFAMGHAGTPAPEVALTLGLTRGELARRTAAIVTRLARAEATPLAA